MSKVDSWARDWAAIKFGGGVTVYRPKRNSPVLLTTKRKMGVRKVVTGRMEKRAVRLGGGGSAVTGQVATTRGT